MNKQHDSGVSLPLVMGALLIFSVMIILLSGMAVMSINHSRWALYRTQALSAAEAGAQDYVNRLNGFASFDSWTAERTKKMRDRGAQANASFPSIVKDSALAQWVSVESTGNAQYTYDVVGNNAGLIVRSTGRSGPKLDQYRTVEYRITRNSDSAVAYVGNRSFAHVDAYAQQAQLFASTTYEQGLMGVNFVTGKRDSVSDYNTNCNQDTADSGDWYDCWRPTWSGHDEVEGNFVTRAPQTIHGPKSFMAAAEHVDSQMFKYAKISGSVTIQKSQPDKFTHPAGFKAEWNSSSYPNHYYRYYTDEEAAHMRNRDTWRYLPYDETVGSSPANYNVIREEADTFDYCSFRGSTHVILYGEELYVRSPHTPGNENDARNEWCKNPTKSLWGKSKRSHGPDISKAQIQAGSFLKPADTSTWTKFTDIPPAAVFLIQKTGTNGCNANVVGDSASVGKSTGIGFPGAPPTVSSADASQQTLYDCKNGDLFIEGSPSFQKTFAAEDNIYLTGGIRYSDRNKTNGKLPVNSDDYLGLVAKRNVIVYNPSASSGPGCTSGGCGKLPRTPYLTPTRDVDLNSSESNGQGVMNGGLLQFMQGIGEEGPVMPDPTAGRPDDKAYWLALPQYDAAIVAEEGSFFLENMNRLGNSPARKGSGYNERPLKMTVTGSVYSKFAPVFHIDRLPPLSGHTNTSKYPNTNMIEVYGMNQRFLFDKRFTKRLPPGFSGHSDSAYRAVAYAEVHQGHLNASH